VYDPGSQSPLEESMDESGAFLINLRRILDAAISSDTSATLIIACATSLACQNEIQWEFEERSHAVNVSDLELASLKRQIDASNVKRTELMNRIDAIFTELVITSRVHATAEAAGSVVLLTETLGSIIDRLTILQLKANRGNKVARASALSRLDHLLRCLPGFLDVVASNGISALPPGSVVKSYKNQP
jgi:hypothetical protein